jgi:hypothetical protein
VSAGYDQTGFMLVGPLLAILAPFPEVRSILNNRNAVAGRFAGVVIVAGCVAYATALSLFQGDWMNAASGSLKWFAPLIYAAILSESGERDELVQAAASAFVIILPIIGLFGIYQYINLPSWDRYWMQFAPIMSVGQPLPYEVRTFSTMNSPASFASFTAAGLLLVWFLRSGWYSWLCSAPAVLSLLLSLYRTAWLSLGVGVLFCLLFSSTRRRATIMLFGLAAGVVVAATATPFADVIGDRLVTLEQGAQDGSAKERLDEARTRAIVSGSCSRRLRVLTGAR